MAQCIRGELLIYPKNGQHSFENNNNCFYFFRDEQDQQFRQRVNNNYLLFAQIVDLY